MRVGDSGYEAARVGWNRMYSRYPETIVFCRNTQDVVNAVEWAREKRIAFRARSGRHSLEGWSSIDGGLVIDVSRIRASRSMRRRAPRRSARGSPRPKRCQHWGNAALSCRPDQKEASASAV